MRKNPMACFLEKQQATRKEREMQRKIEESFDKIADNLALHWESIQQRELALIGGILSHGAAAQPFALAFLPKLPSLAGLGPEEAMRRGRQEWQEAMERLAREVQKLGDVGQGNTVFDLKGHSHANGN